MIIKRTPLRFGALFFALSLVATPSLMMATTGEEVEEGHRSPKDLKMPQHTTDYPFNKISEEPLFAVAMFCLSFIGSYTVVNKIGYVFKRLLFKKDKRVHVTVNR